MTTTPEQRKRKTKKYLIIGGSAVLVIAIVLTAILVGMYLYTEGQKNLIKVCRRLIVFIEWRSHSWLLNLSFNLITLEWFQKKSLILKIVLLNHNVLKYTTIICPHDSAKNIADVIFS